MMSVPARDPTPFLRLLALLEDAEAESGTVPCVICGSRLWTDLRRDDCNVCDLVKEIGVLSPPSRWDDDLPEEEGGPDEIVFPA